MTTTKRSNEYYNGLSSGAHTSPSVGSYVLWPLCILHSDYFHVIRQRSQGQREKSKCLPFQMPVAWVLFSSAFLPFSFYSHFNRRLTLKEVSILCLLASTGAGQAADWPHLGQCQKLASHPRKFQNSFLYLNTRILSCWCLSKYPLKLKHFSLSRHGLEIEQTSWSMSSSQVSFFVVCWWKLNRKSVSPQGKRKDNGKSPWLGSTLSSPPKSWKAKDTKVRNRLTVQVQSLRPSFSHPLAVKNQWGANFS